MYRDSPSSLADSNFTDSSFNDSGLDDSSLITDLSTIRPCSRSASKPPAAITFSPGARGSCANDSGPALEKAVTVTGDIQVKLWVSSDAKDTDFVAKLIDVYPDGRAFNIQEGILRARYRQGFDKKVFMEKGEVYPITIDLQATANAFLPGHKIRLEISCSNFPAYDRNLNTGGDNFTETEWVVARNQVHHGGGYPSYVELRVRASNN
jgi:predicted acyl esterase